METGLEGQVVLIGGATGVIGAAAAREFAREGARLALLARTPATLAALAAECRALRPHGAAPVTGANGGVETLPVDLTDATATARAVAAADAAFGRIDVLVAAAGAAHGGVFWELDDAAWRENLELKLYGTIRLLRVVIPGFIARRGGRIVVVAGNSARQPEPRMLPGAVANAGLLVLVRGLATELGPHGIAINAVNPGPTRSPRWQTMMAAAAAREGVSVAAIEQPFLAATALKRLAEPEEIARHIVFLASGRAAHMTGSSVTVDGGATRSP